MTYQLNVPQSICYGTNAIHSLPDFISAGEKVLLVSDRMMEKLGFVDQIQKILEEEQIEVVCYLDILSEPTDIYVKEALDLFKEHGCTHIISLGGGSCIDTAKAVAVVASNPFYIGDFMNGKRPITQQPVSHIAIPTTAGTGSEVTDVTVIFNTEKQSKMMIKQTKILPEVAIVDPMLTASSPKSVTAASGMDALCHAIESYISKKAHPLTRTFSLHAAKLIIQNIEEAYTNPTNMEARTNMAIAATEAGIAFSNASVTLIHGMSRPIGALFHVPHGISNSMLLPTVLEYTREEAVEDLAQLARECLSDVDPSLSDEQLGELLIERIKKLCQSLNIGNLKDYGISLDEYETQLDKMIEDALESGSPANNPKVPTKEELKNLYRICYDYGN